MKPEAGPMAVIEKIYNGVLIVLTISMFIVVSYNVFMRFVMNQSVGWADELSRFIFIWISFLGAVLAYRSDEHVGLGFLVERIRSRKLLRGVVFLQQLLVLLVLIFLAWYGYKASTTVMNVSPALAIPMSWVYLIVPFCAFLMCLIGIGKLVRILRGGELNQHSITSVE